MNERKPVVEAAVRRAVSGLDFEHRAEESVKASLEAENTGRQACPACGSANRKGNNFCASCGVVLPRTDADAASPTAPDPAEPHAAGEHHYHHHYHHHYFSAADGFAAGADLLPAGAAAGRDSGRVRAPLSGPSLSRAEAALRRVAQDWAMACNTRQLADLVELYLPDATVLRPNVPAVRGAAAIREFFVGLLDAGLSEVELEPLRVEMFSETGYEAGRCKSLVPIAMGKRREERGKYLLILNRQPNGEWKIAADSWSTDLSLGASEVPGKAGVPSARPQRP